MAGNDLIALPDLNSYLEKYKAQIEAALPKHMKPDRMIRLALTSFSQNRKLAECDIRTIFSSIVIASQLGLEIGVAGQGFLVPYKRKCQFIPGWQGLVDLVTRSGRASVWTGAVFQGDEFDWSLGDSPFVKHKPCGEDNIKKMTHTYAIGRVKGSNWPIIEVWPIDRIWKHRDQYNKVGEDHYSFKSPEMYSRKVPLLQVIKYLPKSIELANALAIEGAIAEGKGVVIEGDFVHTDPADEEGEQRIEPRVDQPTRTETKTPPPASDFKPTLDDCKSLVEAGDLEGAADLSRGLNEEERAQIATLIANRGKPVGQKEAKPMESGQRRILAARMKSSGVEQSALEKHIGRPFEMFTFDDFNAAQQYILGQKK